MSTDTAQKLRRIRLAEQLTQREFAGLVGLGHGSVKNYESGYSSIGLKAVETILRHERFRKYTLWVMLDETRPDAGQVAPD